MSVFKNLLELDGHIAFNYAIYKRFSSIGDSCYSDICGGLLEGIHQWSSHNIDDIEECKNDKYTGWTIYFSNGEIRQVYIANWILAIVPNNWKHAKNLFHKYLQIKQQK